MVITERLAAGPSAYERCADLFAADPIGCNMVASALVRNDLEVFRAHDGQHTLGAAIPWSPGYTLTRLQAGAADALADALPADGRHQLFGEVCDVARVAGRWSERVGGSIETAEIFRIYRLGRLAVPDVAGSTSIAGADDIDLAARRAVEFGIETGLNTDADGDVAYAAASAQMSRAVDEGRLRTWTDHGEVVAQLLVSTPCCGAVRIGAVYTPPDWRGNGYGSALTAATAATERARPDVDEVILNTQAKNAMTNRLYRRLGFESVYDVLIVWLDTGSRDTTFATP